MNKGLAIYGDSHVAEIIFAVNDSLNDPLRNRHSGIDYYFKSSVNNINAKRIEKYEMCLTKKDHELFLFSNITTAYSINFIDNIDLDKYNSNNYNSIFCFGTADIYRANNKNQNLESVDIYLNKLIKSFDKSNIIIAYPPKILNFQYNDKYSHVYLNWCELLKNRCIEVGINEPIDLLPKRIIDYLNDRNEYRDYDHLLAKHYYSVVAEDIVKISSI